MLSWILRPQCAACGAAASSLCAACRGSLVELGPCCPRCAEPVDGAGEGPVAPCARCVAQPLPLDAVVSPWRFGGQLAEAIRRLKFARRAHVARDVAPLWAPALAAAVHAESAMVVPVPLHWRRRWARGFDHAWLLALHACAAERLPPPVGALRRVRHAPPQSTLPGPARAANVRGAFVACGARGALTGRAVVLVDDVMTTGATLAAAASALVAAGARTVSAVVVARATSARG